MNNEQTAKVIDRAADIIESKGWAKAENVKLADNTLAGYDAACKAAGVNHGQFMLIDHAMKLECSVCLESALAIAEAEATGVLPSDVMFAIFKALQENTATEFPAYKATFRFAKATMGKRARDLERLLELNDYPTTRQEHVLGWLRGAAEGLRRGN